MQAKHSHTWHKTNYCEWDIFSWFLSWPVHCCYVEMLLVFILLFCIRGFLVEFIGDPLSIESCHLQRGTFFPSWFTYFCFLCFSITTAKIQALYWARAMRVRLCLKPDFGWDTSIASSIEYNVGLRVDIRSFYCTGVCCYNQILDIRWLIKKSGYH